MSINSQQIPILMIMMIILTVSNNLSSCRNLREESNHENAAKGPSTSRFYSQFSWINKFPAPAPNQSRNQTHNKEDYRASLRVTPGGPNPLHN
ncbi:hypothetical protein CASFOL_008154 [Castilleja foliolosa]|uniref:Uncharacterized protein n=1 Tax=Castilleja foliolosa TaxID=1961234 RepID=A0ABD3E260_9LAMI